MADSRSTRPSRCPAARSSACWPARRRSGATPSCRQAATTRALSRRREAARARPVPRRRMARHAPRLTVHHHRRRSATRARAPASPPATRYGLLLRWPAPAALRQTVRLLPRLWRDSRRAHVRGLAWILRERRTIRRTWNACAASLNAMRVGMRATEHERGGTIRNPVFPHRRPVARAGCRSSSG